MIINLIKEIADTRYQALQQEGVSKNAPREGYYFIEKVFERPILDSTTIMFARCKWARSPKTFLEDANREIELLSFYNQYSTGPKDIDVKSLEGKIVHVKQQGKAITGQGVISKTTYYIKWELIPVEQRILSPQDVFFKVFFDKCNTVKDALMKFEKSQTDEVLDRIYSYEATYQEEYFEDHSAYDSASDALDAIDNFTIDAPDAEITNTSN